MTLEINLVPEFIDKAMSPLAESVGNSAAGIWELTFGSHIKLWKQKQDYQHQLNYQDFVEKVNTKLKEIHPDELVEPSLHIIGPAIQDSKFYIDSEVLRGMFANLIAASMNKEKFKSVHPSYVEIIKQLSPDEGKILKFMKGKDFPFYNVYSQKERNGRLTLMKNFSILGFQAGCEHPTHINIYLDNLNRLGLIQLDSTRFILDHSRYEEIEENEFFKGALASIGHFDNIEKAKGFIESTAYGITFFNSCIE